MTLKNLAFIAIAGLALTSCVSEDKKTEFDWIPKFTEFNEQGYWKDCYNTALDHVDVSGVRLSHQAEAFEYGGVTYSSWYGFCPPTPPTTPTTATASGPTISGPPSPAAAWPARVRTMWWPAGAPTAARLRAA